MLRSFSTLVIAALLLARCDGGAGGPSLRLLVEVEGSQTALDQFRFQPSGLTSDGKIHIDGTHLVRRFEASGPFDLVDRSSFSLAWARNDVPVGVYAIRPFVCSSMTNDMPIDSDDYTETQQFFIDDSGIWQSGTDLAHSLFYTCEDSFSNGMGGNGGSSYESEPVDCSEPDRANTMISLQASGMPRLSAATCEASYSPAFGGILGVVFGFVAPNGDHVYAELADCYDPSVVRYPLITMVPVGGCSVPSLLTDGSSGSSSTLQASGGEWAITDYEFRPGGHMHGTVMVTFPAANGGVLSLNGSFDLPVIRVGDGS